MTSLRVEAELRRMAAELVVAVDDLDFLRQLDETELRQLRTTIEAALDARYRPVFRRLEAASRHLPAALAGRLAGSFSPLVLGRTATELPVERAAKILPHVDVDLIAACAPHMDPDSGRHLVDAVPDDLIEPIATRVIAAGDHAAIGRLLAALPQDLAASLAPLLTDGRGLVLVGFHCDDVPTLARLVDQLSETQIVAAAEAALTHHLEAELQDLLDRLPDAQERRLREVAPTRAVAELEARIAAADGAG